jgi:hypothetical protein
MNLLKAFVSGMILPSFLVPFVLVFFALFLQRKDILGVLFIHIIPLFWGIWNVLYFALFRRIFTGNENTKLLMTGGLLGLIVAIIGVFWLHLPSLLGLTGYEKYFPLIGVPIVYAILWRFVVKPLNALVGISERG